MELYDKHINGLILQVSPQLERLGVPHAFTTRTGGVSVGIWASLDLGKGRGDDMDHVRENWSRVCGALGVERDRVVFSNQVHGSTVRQVTSADLGKGLDAPVDYEADALVTDVPGAVLTVFVADCCPILLYDPVRRVVGAVHAGWRGTAAGVVKEAVEGMVHHYHCHSGDIYAAVGPCIDKCCFETGEEVPNAMTAALGAGALPHITCDGNGKYHVDLKGLNALWLTRSGLAAEHIDTAGDCTLCKPDKYWSHRYTKGERGSQAAVIALPGGAL